MKYISSFQDPKSLADVISQMLDQYKLREEMLQTRVRIDWSIIVGKTVAQHTLEIHFTGDKLIIRIDNGPLKHQLNFRKEKMVELINEYVHYPLIKEVIIR